MTPAPEGFLLKYNCKKGEHLTLIYYENVERKNVERKNVEKKPRKINVERKNVERKMSKNKNVDHIKCRNF
jgi:hypothetical protein